MELKEIELFANIWTGQWFLQEMKKLQKMLVFHFFQFSFFFAGLYSNKIKRVGHKHFKPLKVCLPNINVMPTTTCKGSVFYRILPNCRHFRNFPKVGGAIVLSIDWIVFMAIFENRNVWRILEGNCTSFW